MAEKFRNKYRIASHRKPNWDYSENALYFLTIVTQNRECNLGNVVNSDGDIYVELSDFGKIVEQEWLKSFELRDELILHEWVIMPNHLHAIVEIYNEHRGDTNVVETHGRVSLPTDATDATDPIESVNPDLLPIKRNPPVRLPKSISSFIAGFKSAVNTKIDDYIDENKLNIPKYNRNNHFFQPNYHDHIIRNQQEYLRITNYIINNPANWGNDKFHS
jgi:putative transposase